MTKEKTIFEERTIYTITDEHGEKSKISLDKTISDVLQKVLPDVRAWVQEKYNLVVQKKSHLLSRREMGDLVRRLSNLEAEKHSEYHKLLDDLI